MLKMGLAGALCAGLVTIAGSAGAATITMTGSASSTGAIDLDQFDAALGTLNSVTLDYSGSATEVKTATATATMGCNGGGNNCTVGVASASATALVSLTGPLGFSLTANDTKSGSCTTGKMRGNTCTATATAIASLLGTTTFADLAAFIGTGTVAFQFGIGAGDALSSGSLTLTYDYTIPPPPVEVVEPGTSDVPLPAGLPLLLASMGGLALLRRRT